ncbi:hypothetical protein ACOWZD_000944 [Pseudomonas aeruginosa]
MNKANECTCPSGDGSLVHPCPAHPAVEQAGTNVGHGHVFPRADGVKMRCGGPALCSECAADAYRARAALAQPSGEVVVTKNESGAIVSVTRQDKEGRVLSVIAESQPSPALPPFAEKVLAKLRRFNECAEDSDSGGVDIGRHWLDLLTQLGLLNRVQRSPALWEISQQGEDLLGLDVPEIEVPDSMIEKAWQRFERTLQQLETPGQAEQAEQAEAERSALWAVHAQGPDELYAAFSREDAEKHAAELNALPMPEGIAVGAVVVPSPWPAVQHWQYLAEQEQDHKNEIAGRLRQHERIGEALRAEITQLRQHKNDYMDAGQETYRALQNEIREREAEIARLDGLVSGRTAERDAALARVAELEQKSAGSWTVDTSCGRPILMYEGCSVIEDQTAYEVIRMIKWIGELERQEPVAWMHDQPNRVDVIHRDVKDLLQRVPGSSRGIYRPLDVSEHYTIPLYAAPVAQAQHSVPVAREQLERLVRILDAHNYAKDAEALMALLAAAPAQAQHCVPELLVRAEDFVSGKEVPQAWLDVQAERRRQITAEGWTPEHDDLYCAAELPRAAAAYILNGANDEAPAIWPFSAKWWKPRDARSNYVRAGALILAEIERLDRAAPGKEGNDD